jgi:hypothetical protein
MVALGETELDDGFRRVSRAPDPRATVRMRDLLLDAAGDMRPLLRLGIESLESWTRFASLVDSGWLAGTASGSAAARRLLQRRLSVLGTQPISVAAAVELPVGAAVHLRGTIRPMSASRLKSHMSYIWSQSARTEDNVRCLVEEGQHFFLTDESAQTACVMAANGYLINADSLRAGDQVSVFGYTDRTADTRGQTADPLVRDRRALSVRAGDDLPLLLRKISS